MSCSKVLVSTAPIPAVNQVPLIPALVHPALVHPIPAPAHLHQLLQQVHQLRIHLLRTRLLRIRLQKVRVQVQVRVQVHQDLNPPVKPVESHLWTIIRQRVTCDLMSQGGTYSNRTNS